MPPLLTLEESDLSPLLNAILNYLLLVSLSVTVQRLSGHVQTQSTHSELGVTHCIVSDWYLVEWKSFVFDSIRDIHKSVADGTGRSRSCPLLVAAAVIVSAIASAAKAAVAALVLAVGKLLVLYDHIGRIDLLAILIYIAAGLDPAGHQHAHALAEILFSKFAGAVKGYDIDKIRSLTLVSILLLLPLRSTASVYLAMAMERSPWE